jgi:hemolysin III
MGIPSRLPSHRAAAKDVMSSSDGLMHDYQAIEGESSWRFTEWGRVGEFSRDASPHATDEVFNAASHLAATMLSLLGTTLLVVEASAQSNPWKIVSFSIYGASLVFLFTMSTLHHGIEGSQGLDALLRMMDYLAIYPLIAGTLTPLCLVFFHDSVIGWAFLGVVWFISILGMVGTAMLHSRIPKWASMTMYITLGWLGACMTYWLIPVLGVSGMLWLLLGGIFYTAGGWVYTTEQPNPVPQKFGFHEIWHVAVILGAGSHWILMWFFVLPWTPSQ